MSRLLAPVWQWWDGRTLRERRMLTGMLVILGLTAAWLLVVQPALAWSEAAADRRVQARSDREIVRAAAARLRVNAGPDAPRITDLGAVAQVSAATFGLTLDTSMDAAGGLGFRASKASTASVFAWLQDMKTRHGIEATTLSIVENADATLEVEGGLAAAR